MHELLKFLLKHDLTGNQLVLLHCLLENTKLIDQKSLIKSELSSLIEKGLLTEQGAVTPQGMVIVLTANHLFQMPDAATKVSQEEDFLERVHEYRNLFPNMKLPSGKVARSNIEDLKKKMAQFFAKYPRYDWDMVYRATQAYIDAFRQNQFLYMKNASYYISKDRESDLASDCQFLLDGGDLTQLRNSYITVL